MNFFHMGSRRGVHPAGGGCWDAKHISNHVSGAGLLLFIYFVEQLKRMMLSSVNDWPAIGVA